MLFNVPRSETVVWFEGKLDKYCNTNLLFSSLLYIKNHCGKQHIDIWWLLRYVYVYYQAKSKDLYTLGQNLICWSIVSIDICELRHCALRLLGWLRWKMAQVDAVLKSHDTAATLTLFDLEPYTLYVAYGIMYDLGSSSEPAKSNFICFTTTPDGIRTVVINYICYDTRQYKY